MKRSETDGRSRIGTKGNSERVRSQVQKQKAKTANGAASERAKLQSTARETNTQIWPVANYRAEAAMQAARENVRQANEDGSSGRAQLHGCILGLSSLLAA